MKTSLVMATYNGEKYLTKQLDSIRNQTKQLDEVIIVDDKSTDDSVEIVQQYIKKHELTHWKMYVNERNLGFKENFRYALSLANYELLFLCDQDDIWELHKVEEMFLKMEGYRYVNLLASSFSFIDENDSMFNIEDSVKKSNHNLLKLPVKKGGFVPIPFFQVVKENFAQGCCMCVRRGLVKEYLEGADSELPHDWAMVLLAVAQDSCYFYNEELIRYRIHSGNAIGLESYITGNRLQSREYRLKNRTLVLREELEVLEYLCECAKIQKEYYVEVNRQRSILLRRIECIERKKIVGLVVLFAKNWFRKKYGINAFGGDVLAGWRQL